MLAHAKGKILLLDDDASFLEVVRCYIDTELDRDKVIEAYTSPEMFTESVKTHSYLPESAHSILDAFYQSKKIDSDLIVKTLNDLADLSAFLVIDQNLGPSATNGTKLANDIRDYFPESYITLLTSTVEIAQAIELHNEGTINLYIDKQSENPLNDLVRHLDKEIQKRDSEFAIDAEDIFGFNTVVNEDIYASRLKDFISHQNYLSFITTSSSGNISIYRDDGKIVNYVYDSIKKDFVPNE